MNTGKILQHLQKVRTNKKGKHKHTHTANLIKRMNLFAVVAALLKHIKHTHTTHAQKCKWDFYSNAQAKTNIRLCCCCFCSAVLGMNKLLMSE